MKIYQLSTIDRGDLLNSGFKERVDSVVYGSEPYGSITAAMQAAYEDLCDHWTSFEMEGPVPDLQWKATGMEDAPEWRAVDMTFGQGHIWVIRQVDLQG